MSLASVIAAIAVVFVFPAVALLACPMDIGWVISAWLLVGTVTTSLAAIYLLSVPAVLLDVPPRWRWFSTAGLYAFGAVAFLLAGEPKTLGPLLWPGWVGWDLMVPLVWCGN